MTQIYAYFMIIYLLLIENFFLYLFDIVNLMKTTVM